MSASTSGTAADAVYLDYAATTPVDQRVAAAMNECLTRTGVFGNPASHHAYGRQARARVEAARVQVAAMLGVTAPHIVWTSGATESNNLAVLGLARATLRSAAQRRPGHIVTSRTEHKAVLDPCRRLEQEGFRVTYLTPDPQGLIDPEQVREALAPDTLLVSIMHANNEIGVLQDIEAIGSCCRERDIPFHVDAAQGAGKVPIDLSRAPVDLLSLTAHKIYGPKGVGALYVTNRRRAELQPLIFGGGHERGLRSGTLAVHQIVGFGLACELCVAERLEESRRLEALRARLWQGLQAIPGTLLNGHPTRRVAGILNVSFPGIEGESLLLGLPELAVSTGSACNSDSDEPSYVLRALGRDTETAQSSLRFSLGRFSTERDVDVAIDAVRREVGRLRAVAP
jgi:cysteine desulfurase